MRWSFERGDALVLVDVQNDFLPGGALPAPGGARILPALNRAIAAAQRAEAPIFASRDAHPEGHCSFREQGGPWPPHALRGSLGAELARDLVRPLTLQIVDKGTSRERDAYSAFDGTDLDERLRRAGIRRIFLGGLVTEVCVLETARAALRLGYRVVLVEEATAALDPARGKEAIAEMRALGASLASIEEVSP